MGIRGLQKRARRLERLRSPPTPIERWYGSLDAFAAQVQKDMNAGTSCRTDMPIILKCLERWHREGLWGAWQRQSNQMFEFGGR